VLIPFYQQMDCTRTYWRLVALVYYQYSFGTFAEMLGRLPNLSGFKIADRYLLWPVPKLKIDLSPRNASTQGRKTDLVERYQHYPSISAKVPNEYW
jgi:hypothetical protein